MRRVAAALLALAVAVAVFLALRQGPPGGGNESPTPVVTSREADFPTEAEKALAASASAVEGFGLVLTGRFEPPAEGRKLLAALGGGDDAFAVTAGPDRLELYRRQRGKAYLLKESPSLSAGPHELEVVLWGGRVIVSLDGSQATAPVTVRAYDRWWAAEGFRGRSLVAPHFEDRFSRTSGAGEWKIEAGRWKLVGFDYGDRSFNPGFVTAVLGNGDAPEPGGKVLLKGRVGRPMTGFGVVTEPCARGLFVERIAADSPASRAGLDEGMTILSIDGRPATPDALAEAEKRIGERVELTVMIGLKRTEKYVVVPGVFRWGARMVERGLSEGRSAEARMSAGDPLWAGYYVEAAVRLRGKVEAGVALCSRDGLELRVRPQRVGSGGGTWVVERVRGGTVERAKVLGGGFPDEGQWFRLTLRLGSPSELEVLLDGVSLGFFDPGAACRGGIALFASGEGEVDFDDVRVGPNGEYLEPWRRERPMKSFRKEEHMSLWASPACACVDGVYWIEDGPVSDCEVFLRGRREFELLLFSPDKRSEGVTAECRDGSLVFARDGAELRRFPLDANAAAEGVLFVRRGGKLKVETARGRVGVLDLPAGVGAGFVGLRDSEPLGRGVEFRLSAPNLFTDDFTRAPADWTVLSGAWGTTARWTCDPRWSFFGGRSVDGAALVESKYVFGGDCRLDFYYAPMMTVHRAPWEKRGGLMVGLAVRHGDPWSGYMAFIGADCDRKTVLFRAGKPVAEARGRLFPDTSTGRDTGPVHRWYRVVLSLRSGVVTLEVNGRRVLEYADPDPLDGLRPVLGTLRNGMLAARFHMLGETVKPYPALYGFAFEGADGWTPARDGARCRVLSGGGKVRVEMPAGAGTAELAWNGGEVNLDKRGHLTFLYARKGCRADLYFECEGLPFRLSLGGGENEVCGAEAVATLLVPDDGVEHRVELDLRGALARYFPGRRTLTARNFRFACRDVPPASPWRCEPGAWYSVAAFSLAPWPDNGMKPAVKRLSPPWSDDGNGEELWVWVSDPSCGKLDTAAARLVVDGRELRCDGRTVRYEPVFRRFEVDLAALGVSPGKHRLELKGLKTAFSGEAEPWSGEFTVDPSRDDAPPRLAFRSALLSMDFENDFDGARSADGVLPVHTFNFDMGFPPGPGGALFVRRFGDGWNLSSYLRVFNPRSGGPFALGLLDRGTDLRQAPLLVFRWRSDRPLPLEVVLDTAAGRKTIPLFPALKGACDGEWHTITVDLSPDLEETGIVKRLLIADPGYQGVVRGEHYDLDAVRLARIYSPSRIPAPAASDLSGATLYLSLNDGPELKEEDFSPPADLSGVVRLSCRAVDGRGNSTPVYREYLVVDSTPPRLEWVGRRGGDVVFRITDDRFFILLSVTVTLDDGRVFDARRGLRHLGRGEFSFEWPGDEGGEFTVTASDYAGNHLSERAEVEERLTE